MIYDNKSIPMKKKGENAYDLRNGLMRISLYKTSKKYGVYDVILPDNLQHVINDYVNAFLKKFGHKPVYMYGTDSEMPDHKARELVRNVFHGIGGIRVLRPSFKTYIVKEKHYSLKDQRDVARKMGHSLEMSLTYERQLDSVQENDLDEEEDVASTPEVVAPEPEVVAPEAAAKKKNRRKKKRLYTKKPKRVVAPTTQVVAPKPPPPTPKASRKKKAKGSSPPPPPRYALRSGMK